MRKIKNNIIENANTYIIFLLLTFLLYGVFSMNRYIQDTFVFEQANLREIALHPYFYDGRMFTALFIFLMDVFNISYIKIELISWILAIFFLFISMIVVYNILKDFTKNNFLKILLSCCLVASPFVTEFFMFPEVTGPMALGILFAFLSIYNFYNYLKNKNLKNYILSIVMAFMSLLCYQSSIALVVIISLIFCLKFSDKFLTFIKNVFSLGFLYGFAALSDLLLMKLLGSGKITKQFNLWDNLQKIYNGVKNLLITNGEFLPKYFLIVIFTITFVIAITVIIKENRKDIKQLLIKITMMILCVLALIIVPAFPQLLISDVWVAPRSNIGYGLLGVLPIFLLAILRKKDTKIINYFSVIILITLIIFQFSGILNYAKGQVEINALTTNETKEIQNAVYEYEMANNIKVTKLVTYPDMAVEYYYDDIVHYMDINLRLYAVNWAYKFIYSVKTGENYNIGKDDKKIEEYCKNNNWNIFSKDQLNFNDDTMYVCIY